MHEAESHDDNCMVTLTYADDNPQFDGDLHPEHVQLWMKRLRKQFSEKTLKFFLAGEYGDKGQRPHYHVLLFGIDFQNEVDYNPTDTRPCITELQQTWSLGFVHVVPFSFAAAAYVARYCLKKQEKLSDYCDKTTGVVREREFTRMSRRPGIGGNWIAKNHVDTYSDDKVVSRGVISRPPRYYDKVYAASSERNEAAFLLIKRRRMEASCERAGDRTPEKLKVHERVATARATMLKRRIEHA